MNKLNYREALALYQNEGIHALSGAYVSKRLTPATIARVWLTTKASDIKDWFRLSLNTSKVQLLEPTDDYIYVPVPRGEPVVMVRSKGKVTLYY